MPRFRILTETEKSTNRAILVPYRVWEDLDSYDKNLKSKFIRTFKFLSRDMHHPSLQIELIREKGPSQPYYRIRVDPQYRIHFDIREGHFLILAIGPHRLQGIG